MSEKQPKHELKPWEKTFSDDQDLDQEGNLSRTKHRKQNSHNSMVTTILILAIIVLAATPVIYWWSHQSSFNHPQSDTERVAETSSTKKQSADKKSTTKKSTTSATTSSKTTKKASSKASSSSTESSSESSSSESSEDAKYVTVTAGQGIYRIAANNGISVDELRQLNGLSANATLTPGQQLRVK